MPFDETRPAVGKTSRPFPVAIRNSPGQARHVVHAVVSHVDEKLSRAFVFDLRGENPFVSSDH